MLLGMVRVYYTDAKLGVDQEEASSYLIPLGETGSTVNWDAAEATDLTPGDLETEPAAGASFAALPGEAAKEKSYEQWKKSLAEYVYRNARLELLRCAELKLWSKPGESERDFRVRLTQAAREHRDAATEKLRARYAPKLAALQDRIRRAEQAVAVQQEQSRSSQIGTAISFGTAILSAVFGRRRTSATSIGKAGIAVRGVGRSMKESSDVSRAQENVVALQQQLADLDGEFQQEVSATAGACDGSAFSIETVTVKPKKTNITAESLLLAWTPFMMSGASATPAWR
jgi:hypothetical protein